MTEDQLSDWVRWATRRPEKLGMRQGSYALLPTTRTQVEEQIQCTLAQEARALRREDFRLAHDMRENLEEWQSLRSYFPTHNELKRERSENSKHMQVAVAQRDYRLAEDLRNRRSWLEHQIRREEEYLQSEQRFQQVCERVN
jgi:hypothetical protein